MSGSARSAALHRRDLRARRSLLGVFPLSQRVASFIRGDFSFGATARTQPIGLFAEYMTHRLERLPKDAYVNTEGAGGCPTLDHRELGIARGMKRAANVGNLYAFDRIVHYGDNGMPEYETRLTALPDKAAAPIMVVAVTGEIIRNHNDIFTSPLRTSFRV